MKKPSFIHPRRCANRSLLHTPYGDIAIRTEGLSTGWPTCPKCGKILSPMQFEQRPLKWACMTVGCINNLGGLREPAEEITLDIDFARGLCTFNEEFKE